jgi:hypothetical protein
VDEDDQELQLPTTSTPLRDEREEQPRRSRRRLIRTPPINNEPPAPSNQSRRIRFILPAQMIPPTPVSTTINPESSARAILAIARDTMANHLDTGLLRDAIGLDQQIDSRHISTRNQPINLQQSSIIGRPHYRRSRGESYNSVSSARDELYNMTHVMQREVIPSILDGDFLYHLFYLINRL